HARRVRATGSLEPRAPGGPCRSPTPGPPRLSDPVIGALLIALMFVLFAMGLEIAVSLGVVGVLGLLWLKGWTVGLGVVGSVAWSNATSFSFIALPLFVFMSAILLHSGIGRGLYTAVARWVSLLPGGLAVASIFSCAIFAAISGSSVATAATIGMIAIPEMERRGPGGPARDRRPRLHVRRHRDSDGSGRPRLAGEPAPGRRGADAHVARAERRFQATVRTTSMVM